MLQCALVAPAREASRSLLPALEALRARLLRSSCSSEADGTNGGASPPPLIAGGGIGGGGDRRGASTAAKTATTTSSWTASRAFSQADVDAFVALTGDGNPIHRHPTTTTAASAAAPPSPPPLVPGLLLASLFPAIIGSEFPGAVYARQGLRFRAPARVGEAVVAEVSLAAGAAADREGREGGIGGSSLSSSPSSSRVAFDTVVRRAEDGRVLVEGTALAIIPLEVQRRARSRRG